MTQSSTPFEALERTFHEPKRLAILSALAAEEAGLTFQELKAECELTDGNLNRHLKVLGEPGYVSQKKQIRNERLSTRVKLTARGRKAFVQYLESLEAVLKDAQAAVGAAKRKPSGTLSKGSVAKA